MKLLRVRKKKNKTVILGQYFSSPNLRNILKFEIYFSILLIVINTSEVTLLFCLSFKSLCNTGSKHTIAMLLH